ncbi:hypothetical protein [Mesoflavibacter sp. CH_XMU1404-2]|uniref:hypothetical protein n=1 Tax=Mesoflavibacter sp. CH_XMU1404-2 TaxID=3107766 RepID=UPI00300A97DF
MKTIEFDKIEPTWFNIEENTKKECLKNNIEFYDYLGNFVKFKLFNYIKTKALIETIKTLDFNDEIGTRAILNKRHFSNKNRELELAISDFNKKKIEVFEWLDKTKNPYFFILNPVYQYGAGIDYKSWINERYGYIKVAHTGIQNLDIAIDYLKYKSELTE